MSSKRNRLEIIRDILKAIGDKNCKIKPTHILYKANLSHQMLEEYLDELIKGGFIEVHTAKNGGKVYCLTQKGFDFLAKYRMIVDFTDSFGLSQS